MRVLLIGKFPPGQGGIAAKTYWLSRALAPRRVRFDVVTIVPEIYRSAGPGELPETVRVHPLDGADAPPWFIPGGELWTERLVTAALEMAEDDPPDVIEVNYLAPYGLAALTVSRLIGVPLLLRHAGSDLAKLVGWPGTRRGLSELLRAADLVATTPDAASRLPEPANGAARVEMARYVPDPRVFAPSHAPPAEHRLLFAGKLNYHWRLKALDTLAAALKLRPDWRVVAVADGKGREAFESEIAGQGLADRVERRGFVVPHAVPGLLARATAVWAAERQSGIPDFSNLVWEALAAGRPCLVGPPAAEHPDAEPLRHGAGLLVVDPEDPASVAAALDRAAGLGAVAPPAGLAKAFAAYVDANEALYRRAVAKGGRR